jgi:hypothetical protein
VDRPETGVDIEILTGNRPPVQETVVGRQHLGSVLLGAVDAGFVHAGVLPPGPAWTASSE